MRPSGNYSFVRLSGVPFLLPYGQSVADHRRGVRLGDAGADAWEALLSASSVSEFVARAAQGLSNDAERREAEQDYLSFADSLRAMGVLTPPEPQKVLAPHKVIEVAGLRVGISGRTDLLSESFSPFLCKVPSGAPTLHQLIVISRSDMPRISGACVVVQTSELLVLEQPDSWAFIFRTHPNLIGGTVSKDGSGAHFYVSEPPQNQLDSLRDALFHAIRFAFLVLAQQHDRYVLHSCSVSYRDRALLFSGSSGTGKSTHAALWSKGFDTPQLNGDLNILYLKDGQARVCGLPWCGTSGISQRFDLPCAAVVLLRQAPRNQVQELTPDEQQLFLMNRLISPTWTEGLLTRTIAFAGSYAPATHVCRFLATRDALSARVLRAHVDQVLEKTSGC